MSASLFQGMGGPRVEVGRMALIIVRVKQDKRGVWRLRYCSMFNEVDILTLDRQFAHGFCREEFRALTGFRGRIRRGMRVKFSVRVLETKKAPREIIG